MSSLQLSPIGKEIYNKILSYPTKSDSEIAKMLNLSHPTVGKYRKKLYVGIDHQLAKDVAGKFLIHFQMSVDYFLTQVERLEELKKEKKIVVLKDEKGNTKKSELELDPLDILAIEKHQTKLWENIIFLARQSEAVEILKTVKDGRISEVKGAIPENIRGQAKF